MVRTIRTCSLIALALLPSIAAAKRSDTSALAAYAKGRVADRMGDTSGAIASYEAAMTLSQDAALVALRAYRAGVEGGDFALALRGARALDAVGVLPGDARVLLYIGALRERDRAEARARLDAIRREPGYDFLAPLLESWFAFETADKTPVVPGRTTAYATENAALLTIARGETTQGMAQVRSMWATDRWRAKTLIMVAEATASPRRGKREGRVDSALRGASFVLQRAAWDLAVERSPRAGVTLARLAVFADPRNPLARTVMAAALNVAKRPAEALVEADIATRSPDYRTLATPFAIDALEALGRHDDALGRATTLSDGSAEALARLGDIEVRRGRFVDGAARYEAALAASPDSDVAVRLWYALGNARERVGDWPGARVALERALVLAPSDPDVLNQLGYGLADRGVEVDRALGLIRKAEAVAPTNAAIVDSLGWALFRLGRTGEAIVALERARALDPTESEIAEHLGDAYWVSGRRIEARHVWAAARDGAEGARITRINDKIARGPE